MPGLLNQQSPDFWAPGTGFVGDNFFTDQGGCLASGWFKGITSTVHDTSTVTVSAPPQLIRH